jgi:hypothetical protein
VNNTPQLFWLDAFAGLAYVIIGRLALPRRLYCDSLLFSSYLVRAMSSDEPNAYEVLSVAQEASEAEIRKAYRQRSLKVHPDRVRTSRPFLK